jgi:hypothetical protein
VNDVLRQDPAACRFGFQNRAHFAWADLTPDGGAPASAAGVASKK